VVIGLSHGDTDASVADIDYGLRLQAATHELVVYEGGERVGTAGTYAEGDELGISVRAGVVEYRHNGAVVWASTATPQHPLLVDVSMGTAGARIDETWLTGTRGTNVEWFTPRGVEVSGTRWPPLYQRTWQRREPSMPGWLRPSFVAPPPSGSARRAATTVWFRAEPRCRYDTQVNCAARGQLRPTVALVSNSTPSQE